MTRVLVIDDEASMRRILTVLLRDDGCVASEASGVKAAARLLQTETFDLVISDQRMGDGDGLAVLAICRELDPTLPVILLTAHATIELAVEAMRDGAFDFITKPFQPESVRLAVRRAADHSRLLRENRGLKAQVGHFEGPGQLIGASPALELVRHRIRRVAPTNATVLITGETGTGKELVARAIHRGGPRAGKPFIAINCAALPEPLLESQLFGHERGAFTGADKLQPGLFEACDGGTLFLDEAADMSLALQAKLLRVLLDGEFTRVGSTSSRKVDVRVLAATHRNLELCVRDGTFRQDLFYRLNVVPIHVAPLRERREDIPMLIEYFMQEVAHELKLQHKSIHPRAVEMLTAYSFPGNVRELRNLIERAFILAPHIELGIADFPLTGDVAEEVLGYSGFGPLQDSIELHEVMERFERELIEKALRASHGAQAEAARRLGISRSDMAYKVRKHGLRHLIAR